MKVIENLENIQDKIIATPKIFKWYHYPLFLLKMILFSLLNIVLLIVKLIVILYQVI